MLDQTLTDALIYHHSMLHDEVRTSSFLRAILDVVRPGDVVLDIGSGTGILALFACLAGARHVYAVEQGSVIEVARQVCQDNGFGDRVTFINQGSNDVELSERADVLVTETIGNAAYDEGILGWVQDARERLLHPGARMIPNNIELIAAPVKSPLDFDLVRDWRMDLFGFDFSAIRNIMAKKIIWTQLSEKALLGIPAMVTRVELDQVVNTEIIGDVQLEITKNGWLHGLCVWFSAELIPGLFLSNEPPSRVPSWSQGFLPLRQPVLVHSGDRIQARIASNANGASWSWEVDYLPQHQLLPRPAQAKYEERFVNF